MSDTCHNCEAIGGAQAKTGDNRKALSRPAGMAATAGAIESKTRSGHPATSTANHWVGAPSSYGDDNIKGYGG
jgi:hypothetical protein